MSVTVTKSDGVTVFTLTSDPQSTWPPLCQILKNLCYSPVCCSVSHQLRAAQGRSQSVLGTLQIMVGLLNIGLGLIMCFNGGASWWRMDETGFPFWMGGLFIVFGISCILSEKFPSPCLIIVTVILNLVGVLFAIAALVLYIINITDMGLWWLCEAEEHRYHDYDQTVPSTVTSEEQLIITERCEEGKAIILFLLRGINCVLIVASLLQICVSVSSAVLGIKALKSSRREDDKRAKEPEQYRPLLEGDSSDLMA